MQIGGKILKYDKKTLIIAVVAIFLIGIAFYAGAKYEKSKLSKMGLLKDSATSATGSPASSNSIKGTITAKDDKSVTIKTNDGSSQTVSVSSSTTYGQKGTKSLADLAIGEEVAISGQKNSDGTFSAQSIKKTSAKKAPSTPQSTSQPAAQDQSVPQQ